jgi:predicted FMN-binding regulatory protein PaiB
MESPDARFAPPSVQDVTRLVLEHPFAWIVSTADGDFFATPLPVRPVVDTDGHVVELRGHFARSNPHVEHLRRAPRALILFMGPHGYISSSWLADRTRTPTWNYAMAQYVVDIELVEDPGRTDELIRDLVDAMEAGRSDAWSLDEMGDRYRRLVTGVVGFHARICERRTKFKLGQDERDVEYRDIVAALRRDGDHALLASMQNANAGRNRQA